MYNFLQRVQVMQWMTLAEIQVLRAQVFNNLPSSIKETESLLIFKTLVKDFYIGNS